MTYTFCIVEDSGRPLFSCSSSDVTPPSFPTVGLLFSVATFSESNGLVLDSFASRDVQVVYQRCAWRPASRRAARGLPPLPPKKSPPLHFSPSNLLLRPRFPGVLFVLAASSEMCAPGQVQALLGAIHALMRLLLGGRALEESSAAGLMRLKRLVKGLAPLILAMLDASRLQPSPLAAAPQALLLPPASAAALQAKLDSAASEAGTPYAALLKGAQIHRPGVPLCCPSPHSS